VGSNPASRASYRVSIDRLGRHRVQAVFSWLRSAAELSTRTLTNDEPQQTNKPDLAIRSATDARRGTSPLRERRRFDDVGVTF
jgi:hypothetical protein